jgi:hypothetical protein
MLDCAAEAAGMKPCRYPNGLGGYPIGYRGAARIAVLDVLSTRRVGKLQRNHESRHDLPTPERHAKKWQRDCSFEGRQRRTTAFL